MIPKEVVQEWLIWAQQAESNGAPLRAVDVLSQLLGMAPEAMPASAACSVCGRNSIKTHECHVVSLLTRLAAGVEQLTPRLGMSGAAGPMDEPLNDFYGE